MNAIRIIFLLATAALSGCASTQATNPADPLEPLNRGIYQFNEAVDKAVIKPVARGYSTVVPGPVKMMVGNFFSNLDDIIVTANDLLQLKVVQGLSDGTRLVVNTTVGLYGLVDVATMVGLQKHNEDFGQTLGRWGVGPGPYVVIPFLGPSTVRDGIGLYVDGRPSRLRRVNDVPTRNQLYALKMVNARARLLDQEKILDEAIIDRYAFIRDAYLLRRKSLVYDGNPPRERYDYDEESDDTSYEDTPATSEPAAQQETAPADQPADSAAQPATDATAQPAADAAPAAVPEPEAEAPGVNKVWVSQNNDTN